MIVLEKHNTKKTTCAVFDFDGTLSTLRCGWESVMEPLMLKSIFGEQYNDDNINEVRTYIEQSTGIQTIFQMKWLAERVKFQGKAALDPWEYKFEYNRQLMLNVEKNISEAKSGNAENYLIKGAKKFLNALKLRGIKLYAASGTDEKDVIREAEALGIADYFEEIAGAKPYSEDCSKEATLKRLIERSVGDILVVGDGPVEIRLGKESDALTLGICGKESALCGFDDRKVKRLTAVKAHALTDCFENTEEILSWMEN